MDESKVPLYQHVVKEIEKENLFESSLIAPSINLVLKGSPKRIEVDCIEPLEDTGWDSLMELYQRISPWKDIDRITFVDVMNGFDGYDIRGINTYRHKVSEIQDSGEKSRLLRLMLDRPSTMERIVYSARSFLARDDIFQVRKYLSSTLNYINESWGGDQSVHGIIYKDAARLRLKRIGEYRFF